MFPIIVTSLDSIDNKHGIQRQVRRCRRRRNVIYYIEYFRKAAGILLIGVWCKNIRYDIPILGWPIFSRGDKLLGHTPTRVIIGISYRIFLHQTPINRIPAALRKYSI
jgi:hypothetical protein